MRKKMFFKNVGRVLREKREAKSFSQTEVASLLECKPQFVSNWERGMSTPPLPMLRKLSAIYGWDREDLLCLLVAEHKKVIEKALR